MLKQMCLTALVAMTLGSMVGCSDDDKGPNNSPGGTNVPTELIATWTFQAATVTIDGTTEDISLSYLLPWEEGRTAHARITINDDGTFVFDNVDTASAVFLTETGSFTVDGSSFSLTGDDELLFSGNWMVSGSALKLTATEMGSTVVLVATK